MSFFFIQSNRSVCAFKIFTFWAKTDKLTDILNFMILTFDAVKVPLYSILRFISVENCTLIKVRSLVKSHSIRCFNEKVANTRFCCLCHIRSTWTKLLPLSPYSLSIYLRTKKKTLEQINTQNALQRYFLYLI